MAQSIKIIIILNDFLRSLGLKTLLKEVFDAEVIAVFQNLSEEEINVLKNYNFNYLFIQQGLINETNKKSLKNLTNKLIWLSESPCNNQDGQLMFNITQNQEDIVEQIQMLGIFSREIPEDSSELSEREIEVLKLVTQGFINKEIADKLCISTHTVISHRKNITAKLGIKTVSGLTVYAVLNGLIDPTSIQ